MAERKPIFRKRSQVPVAILLAISVTILFNFLYLPESPRLVRNLDKWSSDEGSQVAQNSSKIPKIAHFAIGFDSKLENVVYDLHLFQYLAIKAARVNGQLDDVYLHYHYKPEGKWFNKSMKYVTKLIQTDMPDSVFGIHIDHFAHRKDVYLLQILMKYGGIFADLDIIILRNLDDLLHYDTVMGLENYPPEEILLNAFTMSKNTSIILEKWLDAHREFSNHQWTHFSCEVPMDLGRKYPQSLHILNQSAVSEPSWFHQDLKQAYLLRTYDYTRTNYATHLWETITIGMLEKLTIEKIWGLETSLFCELRKLTTDEEGAGKLTPEKVKECQVVDMAGAVSRVKGLIGKWNFQSQINTKAPKIIDSSGNIMHGIVSLLNGYELVNNETFVDSNDFTSLRGDHVYLPLLPEATSQHFTLAIWLRFTGFINGDDIYRATLVSIEYAEDGSLNIDALSGDVIQLEYEYWDGSKMQTMAADKFEEFQKDTWYLISAGCNFTKCWLRIEAVCSSDGKNESSSDFLSKESSLEYSEKWSNFQLQGIWLGLKKPDRYFDVRSNAAFDLSNVIFYDYPLDHEQLLASMKGTRCFL